MSGLSNSLGGGWWKSAWMNLSLVGQTAEQMSGDVMNTFCESPVTEGKSDG